MDNNSFRACRAMASKGAQMRCPKMARTAYGYCADHADPNRRDEFVAPGIIMVRFQLTEKLAGVAETMGVRVVERSEERQAQLVASRKKGTAVFGNDGLKAVAISGLASQMDAVGFVLVDEHVVYWERADHYHYCLVYARQGDGVVTRVETSPFYRQYIGELTVDAKVYHNPPSASGVANYSLDCRMADGEATHTLEYIQGHWTVFQVEPQMERSLLEDLETLVEEDK